ncbi:PREDICTED: tRNA wybutosine-synthesizing protein 3 homolog isoform X2 [Crocodylus porosus]|uniref:tRNA wybutosine-synthesizing protein 3 homolog isoform X2 n=1 Tax=Crocodylus porosus TaxID=8502 RepID=UPI000939705F|nr:PREDICTED: tRNA wybutosine-synthesizing protein 3 homolog isoform X2 [Crocodylus porosus]
MAAAAAAFGLWREQRLARADTSRKGRLDLPVAGLVQLLNGQDRFCTTSSCSGRVLLAQVPPAAADSSGYEVQKKNCVWLMVTHHMCTKEEMTALQKATGDAVFKFEPFVLHVLCRELQDAQLLHSAAINSGFRNSGITVGRRGKIMMAVRSTHSLEVPLSQMGKLMVTEEYVDFLVQIANRKMEENLKRIDRFYRCLQLALKTQRGSSSSLCETVKTCSTHSCRSKRIPDKACGVIASPDSNSPCETVQTYSMYVRRRKRSTDNVHGVNTSPDNNEDSENEDDPEINLNIFEEIY